MDRVYDCLEGEHKKNKQRKHKGAFVIEVFEAAGSNYEFSLKGVSKNPEYARHIFNNDKISAPIRCSFENPNEEKLAEYYKEKLSSRKMRTWFLELDIPHVEYDCTAFCLALAQEFYCIVKDGHESSTDNFKERYCALYSERHPRLIDQLRKVLKTSDASFRLFFDVSEERKIHNKSKCSSKLTCVTLKKTQGKKYDVTQLQKYLRNNVVAYVGHDLYGAQECRDDFNSVYEAQDKLAWYQKSYSDMFSKGFGEMMTSLILENVMKAPKLFNRIQMVRNGGSSIYESVHLAIASKNDVDYFQLILGVAGVNNNICDSINAAFELIKDILENDDDIFDFLYRQIMTNRFSPQASEVLMKCLIDPDASGLISMDEGFGVFITYSPSVEKSYTLHAKEYNELLMSEIDKDMKTAEDVIKKLIEENSLQVPVNFYVFPLDDVEEKGPKMFKALLGGRE